MFILVLIYFSVYSYQFVFQILILVELRPQILIVGQNSDKLIAGTIPELAARHPGQVVHKITSTVGHLGCVLPSTVITIVAEADPSIHLIAGVVWKRTFVPASGICTACLGLRCLGARIYN